MGGSGSGTVERPRNASEVPIRSSCSDKAGIMIIADPSPSINGVLEAIIAMQSAIPHLRGVWLASRRIPAAQAGIDAMMLPVIAAVSIGAANALAGCCIANPTMTPISNIRAERCFT